MLEDVRLYDPSGFETFVDQVRFDASGLVAAIAQQAGAGDILMLAWMNRESLARTFQDGVAVYWSRSRGQLWRKGEQSGQTQRVIDIRLDCDGDSILLVVDQTGVACHTGRRSCFFRAPRAAGLAEIMESVVTEQELYAGKDR